MIDTTYRRSIGYMKEWFFDQVHQRNLIYNQCWEDPAIDHEALKIGPQDRIVTITSAGCNALDYLLKEPESIDCVDVNPHQTALLELKLAALRNLDHDSFFSMFGIGRLHDYKRIYIDRLRKHLSSASQAIWDRRIVYFDPAGRGLYYSGTSGLFAGFLKKYIDWRPNFRYDLDYFQRIPSVEQQARFYHSHIAPQLWTKPIRWFLRRSFVMSLLGVPSEQIRQMRRAGVTDLSTIVEQRVERTFTTVLMRDNYFWRVYMNGHYTRECCPNYLRIENFESLRDLSSRIRMHTTTIENFLRTNEGPFSIFVLLDHMDWLASKPDLLRQEWQWILHRATAGARIIYRSGGSTFDHIPEPALKHLTFAPALTNELNDRDRVGTYGSFHLARVEL